ncbi:guanylate kinase [Coxiella endosymbiont of Amblyomma nuttalli]|uniref:guanylate kinase n=1 Tax=Coxiella endosymbiont of Amblyomma nuttalli TaxID=2749996 RepID=UPI001BA5368C|nr:guanylate kinase [Coxiella endosymbiont of Amblyomma nuttalli]QTS83832.1 Guanylate kinase [Coxiella endosymbiont of Amblyomma nuttalli]
MNKSPYKANLFVISAPSGAGKTSLVRALVNKLKEIKVSISYTTRPMRYGDKEGVDYFFIDENRFEAMVKADAFLEYAAVYGYHYGTAKDWVIKQLKTGKDILLEIDWQGAQQIHCLFPPALLIFILPPSASILKERLMKRHQDEKAVITQRIALAREEMTHYSEFNYIVVNHDFNQALKNLVHIISAARLQLEIQEEKLANLLEELLKKRYITS